MEVDHIIPLHQGGPDTLSNSQTLCIKCHQEKTKNERFG
ncbi:MAG: HNH endonuclease [Planctomyces sp.]